MSALALLLLISLGVQPAAEPCDASCDRQSGEKLIQRHELKAAIGYLTDAIERHPDDPSLPLLLARAYVLDGDLFWAERTLNTALLRQPGDAETQAWLALVYLRQSEPDLARAALPPASAPPDGPGTTRHSLLAAQIAELSAKRDEAKAALEAIPHGAQAFPEDRAAWEALKRQLDPWWIASISGDIELAGGATSNALAGSPTDPGVTGTGSGLVDGTFRLRLAPQLSAAVRPVLDIRTDGHFIAEDAYSDLSSLERSGRLGVMVSRGRYRLLGGFRAETLDLDQTPSSYSEARRAELELESTKPWLIFGGAGHREYREDRRTRNEWDAGGGRPFLLRPDTSLVVGATIRGHSAHSRAYDLLGASIAATATVELSGSLTARISGSASLDDYLHSGGVEGLLTFGTADRRRDLTGKIIVGLWRPAWRQLSAGLEAQLARRDSTADDRPGFDFDYTEKRVQVLFRFRFGADPSAPRVVRTPGHVPLEWGIAPGKAGEAERIIDLLRQDEDLRREAGCGCGT